MAVSADFRKQIQGYGLTTAEILYRMPDHPALLQSYVWQEYDLFPQFPNLKRFLDFWSHQLDGVLHTITVAHRQLIRPAELKAIDGEFRLN
jgi:Usg protein, probable subunit of phosphoribosylanthranilate isomerase